MLKRFLHIVCLCVSLCCFGNSFGTLSYKKAIYVSSKQSMLSQKIAKLLLMKKVVGRTSVSEKELYELFSEFETNLFTLKNNADYVTTKVRLSLRHVQKELTGIKTIDHLTPSEIIVSKTQRLFSSCEILTENIFIAAQQMGDLDQSSPLESKQLETIIKASRQSMLSHQLAFYFIACQAQINSRMVCYNIEKIRAEQKNDLEYFIFNSLNNDTVEDDLNQITVLYDNLDFYVAENFNKRLSRDKIIDFSNKICNVYSDITLEYVNFYGAIPDLTFENLTDVSSSK